MPDSAVAITNLLHRYAELMDAGDLTGAADLFAHAAVVVDHDLDPIDAATLLAVWNDLVIIHDDGTPRTKHVVTNPQLEIDEAAGRASARSYYTVLQQVGDGPLAPIVAGRYHDEFERVDQTWRFSRRDYSLMDLVGDVSRHLRRRP